MSERSFSSIPLSKNAFLMLGFGYLRNRTDSPWFKYRELVDAIPESSARNLVLPSRGGFSRIAAEYIQGGYLQGKPSEPGSPGAHSQQSFIKATEEGEDLLLQGITYSVTHEGLTIPGLLHVPCATESVLQTSDIQDRVIRAISGAGYIALSSE